LRTELRTETMEKSHCKKFTGIAVADGDIDREMLLARLRCKQWDCDYCAVQNRRVWRAHIIDIVNKLGGDWLFLTITAHSKAHKAGKTIINLKNAWKKLYDRLRYKFEGQKLEYVWIFEKHTGIDERTGKEKQTYHIHAILRAKVDGDNVWNKKKEYWYHPEMHNWLKDNSAEVGAGYMCHCTKIQDGNGGLVSAYITKYMTKDSQNLQGFPARMRRVSTSRGFGSPKRKESDKSWQYRQFIMRSELWMHTKITDVSTGHVLTEVDFGVARIYPLPYIDE